VKTIEQVPISEDTTPVGIREILTRLQSYIETESTLPVKRKEIALDKVKEIAIQATVNTANLELKLLTTLISEIDSRSDLWSQIITALTMETDVSAVKLILSIVNIRQSSAG
jgi:hypothetical protein